MFSPEKAHQVDCARAILHEWVESESLRKHCYAVADSMRHFARERGADPDLWEAVGLLHDMDYERHPNLERSATDGHPFVAAAWLREQGWSEEVCRAILSHADYAKVARVAPSRENACCGRRTERFRHRRRARPSEQEHPRSRRRRREEKDERQGLRPAPSIAKTSRAAQQSWTYHWRNVIAEVIAALKADAERLGLAGTRWAAKIPAEGGLPGSYWIKSSRSP